jgi:hypothetical protein
MIKVLIASHMQDTDDELKVRIDYRLEKLLGNPLYPMFQPDATKLNTLLVTFKTASNTVKDNGGGTVAVGLKNKAKDELNQFVKLLNMGIEVEANKRATDEEAQAFAEGTGANVSAAKKAARRAVAMTYLETPTGFKALNDELKQGAYILMWNAVKGAIMYVIEELNEDGTVKNVTHCDKLMLSVAGVETEIKRTFRLKAIGTDTITSDYTENVSVWVR